MIVKSNNEILLSIKPVYVYKKEDKLRSYLYLSDSLEQRINGGKRTQGLFKHSYRKIEGNWCILNNEGEKVIEVSLPEFANEYEYLPLITVVTVVYNGDKYLEKTIESVLGQTYPNFEYIIIDGGSSDRTLEIIQKYNDKIDYWVSEPDNGIYEAMNKGLSLAAGSWINFMNAGDSFYSFDTLKKINLPEFDFDIVYGSIMAFDEKTGIRGKKPAKQWELDSFIKGMPIRHQGAFVSLAAFKKEGIFNLKYKVSGDYEWFTRAVIHGLKGLRVETIVADFMLDGISGLGYRSKIENLQIAFEYFNYKGKLFGIFLCIHRCIKLFVIRNLISKSIHKVYRQIKFEQF